MPGLIKNTKGCDKLKTRTKKKGGKLISQNCSQKCKNAVKKGHSYKSFSSIPKQDIRSKVELCGKTVKKLSAKDKKKIKAIRKKQQSDFDKFRQLEKEFNKTALITKVEGCAELKNKRKFNIRTLNCRKECEDEFKKGNYFKKERNPNYCGEGVKNRSKKKTK